MAAIDWFIPSYLREEHHALRRARVLVGTAFGLTLAFVAGTLLRLAIGAVHPRALAVALASVLVVLAAPFVLRATGSLKLAGAMILVDYAASVVAMGVYAGGLTSPMIMAAPMAPLLAVFLLDSRAAILTAALLSLVIVVLAVLPLAGVELGREHEGRQDLLARALVLLMSMLLVTFIAAWHDRQRSEVESQLRQSEKLYRWIFEQTKDAVALSTPDGRQVDVNQAGVDLYGFDSKEELLARDAASFYVDPRDRDALVARLRACGYVQGMEVRHRKRGGEVMTVQSTVSTVRDDAGEVIRLVGIVRDVTAQKRAEAQRETVLAELADKNAELERFTYTVSHDLKSPLISIRSFLGLLEKDVEDGDRVRIGKDIGHIANAAKKMQILVDDLLELTRIRRQTESWSQVPLGAVAREVVELLAGRIAQRRARVEIAPDLPAVRGDRTLLRMIFQNLIENALKYSSNRRAPRVTVGLRRGGGETVYFVGDDGIGIAREDRDRVFGLFEQVDATEIGTGIGLTTVKRAVEVHGGRVWVESEGKGMGSTFCFTLPEADAGAGRRRRRPPG
jgi:PAS domain S-box-containing protein